MNLDNADVSRILVEPNRNKCIRLCKILNQKLPDRGVLHIRSKLRALQTRSMTALVCNSTLSDLLENKDTMEELSSITKAIVGTFSLHYVIPELIEAYNLYSIPVFGCGYVLGPSEGNRDIIDDYGVKMSSTPKGTSVVKWGRDKEYTEPLTAEGDYQYFCSVVEPHNLDINMTLMEGSYSNICTYVKAFVPHNYK